MDRFTVLFDYDSMIYKAVYKIASFKEIWGWYHNGKSRDWVVSEILNLAINRLSNMADGILAEIEDTGIDVQRVEYFLTVCPKSKRKLATENYKSDRKRNKWVSMVRKELIKMDAFVIHPEWEADDLIKDRSVEIENGQYVICSIDKDLKQIPGVHFNYYRKRLLDENGDPQLDENGYRKVGPCVGLSVVSIEEANYFFWSQMLMGDSGDKITGIPRIGKVKAQKILADHNPKDYENVVFATYLDFYKQPKPFDEVGFWKGVEQFELHKLLIGLGVKHRP